MYYRTRRIPKNKWKAIALCVTLGLFGGHKFYEEKPFVGFLYLFTMGLGGIGVVIDFLILMTKPKIYYIEKTEAI